MERADKDYANITYIFSFERTHNVKAFDIYMDKHWADSFVYSGVYLIAVFGGQYVMKDRERFELRPFLVTWSGLLAVFSTIGCIRTVQELIWALSYKGFEYTCCSLNPYLEQGSIAGVWSNLFVLSKVVELGDTVFIVLRKQPLIFLHWYHHVTVLIYVWVTYVEKIATGRYYIVMNFTVHSFMYTYYTLRALKFRLPRWVNMFITSLQLAQMVFGIYVILVSYHVISAGRKCGTNYRNIKYCLLMYCSYLVLFLHYFYNTYFVKKQAVHEKKQ